MNIDNYIREEITLLAKKYSDTITNEEREKLKNITKIVLEELKKKKN